MYFDELINKRYSVRNFSNQEIELDKIYQILNAGRIAPTAANKQPQKIFVLQSKESMTKAKLITRMMYNAPLALLICYDDSLSWKGAGFGDIGYDGGEVDASIIATHMILKATELELGTLWVRGFFAEQVNSMFELPDNIHPVCFVLLAYPDVNTKPAANHIERRTIEDITVWL